MAELSARHRPFPLVPRAALVGGAFGERRSSHRGRGADLAGSRAYRPGDPIRSIDWAASARLSASRDSDEFVVREFFADETPRVFLVIDHGASMRLYEPPLPWLWKKAAALGAAEAIGTSAAAARSDFSLVTASGVVSPGAVPISAQLARAKLAPFDDDGGDVGRALVALLRKPAVVTPGSFLFVVSDFLHPVPTTVWSRYRATGGELVPVVVQDPVWEQSFPALDGVTVRFAEVGGGDGPAAVRLSAREARVQAARNEQRFDTLLRTFRSLAADPVVIASSLPASVDAAFARWADRRRRARRSRS